MSLRIIDCEQGSPEWHAARAGIPTASEFHTVLASGRTRGSPSITRRKYMLTLIGQRMTGEVCDGYRNRDMERGHLMEPDARRLYAMLRDADPQQVGFLRRDDLQAGASPDSLVGDLGMLEIKTRQPDLHLDLLLTRQVPSEHVCQLQGGLWIAAREWIDFMSYWPKLPPFIHRVYRDEKKIAEIAVGVREFNEEMLALEQQFRAEAA